MLSFALRADEVGGLRVAAAAGKSQGRKPKRDGEEAVEILQKKEEREDSGGSGEGFFIPDLANVNLWLQRVLP